MLLVVNKNQAAGLAALHGVLALMLVLTCTTGVGAQHLSVTTLAGIPGAPGGADGAAHVAQFDMPQSLAVDAAGHLYVGDTGHAAIRKVRLADGHVTTLVGWPWPGGFDYFRPTALAVDASGIVYVADQSNHVVRRVSPAGAVTILAGLLGVSGASDGFGSAARFNLPSGIAVDSAGVVYVADTGNHSIRRVTPEGLVTTFAGLSGSPGGHDGVGEAARFLEPYGLAIGAQGEIYVTENNHTLRKVSASRSVSTLPGWVGLPIAVDPQGHLYWTAGNGVYYRAPTGGGRLAAGGGADGTADGVYVDARFRNPLGVAVDHSGTVYIADTGNHTIRRAVHVLPDAFQRIAPRDGIEVFSSSVTLWWNMSTDGATYSVCVDTTDNGACDSGYQDVGSNTTWLMTGVVPGTTYFWHVRAQNPSGFTYAGGDPSVFWRFRAPRLYPLTVQRVGHGTGEVTSTPLGLSCGNTCEVPFEDGQTIILTATAAADSLFVGWSGAGCSGTGQCTVLMNAPTTVTATFMTKASLVVLREGEGSGTVTSSPPFIDCGSLCGAYVPLGTTVTLTATPSEGSRFGGWLTSGCLGTTECTILVQSNLTVTAWFPAIGTGDSDFDGLPDWWETKYGLNPYNGFGQDGALGDPDDDGATNLIEYQEGTNPVAAERAYFAEGAAGEVFDTRLALLNPDVARTASVVLKFQTQSGAVVTHSLMIPPSQRRTVDVRNDVPSLAAEGGFSTEIRSHIPVVADRTMSWVRPHGWGTHAETATPAPATTWYLAEGATHSGFQLYYLLQNPGSITASVTITYLLPAPAAPVVRTYQVGPNSRRTLYINDEPGLASTDVSAQIVSTLPVIVERAMYLNLPGQFFGVRGPDVFRPFSG
jgi:sugar lactone lactonase YvrE